MQVQRYRSKISGPLLDRFDIHVDVPSLDHKELTKNLTGETSSVIRERVNKARTIQKTRFNGEGIFSNSQMMPKLVKKYSSPEPKCINLLETAIKKLGLSARAYDRILKVSRTIADLDSEENVKPNHILEAIQYRSMDRYIV